jgi:hypothetical protein
MFLSLCTCLCIFAIINHETKIKATSSDEKMFQIQALVTLMYIHICIQLPGDTYLWFTHNRCIPVIKEPYLKLHKLVDLNVISR